MNILLNGQPRELAPPATLADAIALLAPAPLYAAAVNREVVPRSSHAERELREGDEIEVIRPVTGG